MLIIRLFRYFFGYVSVVFSGDFCERILNLCAKDHITLWNIERKDDTIVANLSVKNFKKIRHVRAKSRVHIKIINKIGLPFIIKRYKLRLGIPVGVALLLGMMIFFQSFIWQIYIVGNEKISEQTILNACEELGIKIGVPIKSIDSLKQKEELLLKVEGLAWASLNIEGCRLTVNVSEIKNDPARITAPSDLYAKFDGVVNKITVSSGIACVKVGDAVMKGDILVKGKIELPNSGVTEYVRSQGEILATTEHKVTSSVKKKSVEPIENGKNSKKSVLNFFGINIPLYLGEKRAPYLFETKQFTCTLFKEKLPISIKTKTFSELEYKEVILTDEQAIEKAIKNIENAISNKNYQKIDLINEVITNEKDTVKVTRHYKCTENIVYEEFFEENILK